MPDPCRSGGRPRRRAIAREPGRPGRPRQAPEKLRSKRLRIRLSESELALLIERADGRSLPAWVRERLFAEARRAPERIPAANREIAGQLAKIGNNLNQLVRLAHTGRLSPQLEPLLHRLYRMLAEYQRELLGAPW